ncbi:MAG: hypothetical protein ABS987_01490 [Ruminococcus sp.]
MELCTFEINLTNKEITFVFLDSDLKRPHKKATTVSFDKVVADMINVNYNSIEEITDKLEVKIADGKEVNDPISADLYSIMFSSENVIEQIIASVVEYSHLETKKQMNKSLKIKSWEKALKAYHKNLYEDIDKSKAFVANGFQFDKNHAFNMTVSFDKNRAARVILKDSFRQFIDIFTYMVYLKDLHIFTCKNCGTKYLAVADMDYCTAPECLEEREKAKRRTKRQSRKYDPFVRPLDNFHEYARGRKREMTLAGATEEELAAFEELHKKHADYIRGSLDAFKNKGELPDDEFYQICKSFKKELKARADYVIEQKRNQA